MTGAGRTLHAILFAAVLLGIGPYSLPVPVEPAAAYAGPASRPSVVAYLDTGINPYHETFRRPGLTAHPSTYLEGYPTDAQPLYLTFDAASYDAAVEADAEVWESVVPTLLYYVPETNIVGLTNIWALASPGVLDENGHGTLVADAGSGGWAGTAPDSLIVMIKTEGHRIHPALEWVAGQPWIDVVSMSLGFGLPPARAPSVSGWNPPEVDGPAGWTAAISAQGRLVVNAAGNGLVPNVGGTNLWDSFNGPPWVMAVGGFEVRPGSPPWYDVCWHCDRPIEVAARMVAEVATHNSFDETRRGGGTSTAAPTLAGYAANLVRDARERLGDSRGFHDGVYAAAAPGVTLPLVGPLADGFLERDDVEELLRHSAEPVPMVHSVAPFVTAPVPLREEDRYLEQGYGIFRDEEYQRARSVLLGLAPEPSRPNEDAWHDRLDSIAYAYWHPWVCAYFSDGDVSQWPGCWATDLQRLAEDLVPAP